LCVREHPHSGYGEHVGDDLLQLNVRVVVQRIRVDVQVDQRAVGIEACFHGVVDTVYVRHVACGDQCRQARSPVGDSSKVVVEFSHRVDR
jgi:hypothetical protein